jgi:hypothetical protein
VGYKVLNDFVEKYHNNTLYREGDDYPKDGFKSDSSRVKFLQEAHPTYGVPFLDKPIEPEKVAPSKAKRVSTKSTAKSGDK